MEDQSSSRLIQYLPQVLAATFLVAVCPVLLLGILNATGVMRSVTLSVMLAMAWSVLAAWAGGRYWRSRPRSGDVVFGDLMLWGWVRRLVTERRLRSTLALLEGIDGGGELTLQQRRDLLLELANALEAGDPYTSGHSRRVARYAEEIAKGMGLSARQIAKVRTAAALHDIGKVRTPVSILHKPDRLSDEEFAIIRAHPEHGAEMVTALGDRELTAIIRHHHERLDGTGYPSGLARDSIPLGARIIAVADTFDAVTSVRPYRTAIAHRRALDILTAEAGTQLDPAAVRAFHRYYTGSRPLAIWVSGTTAAQRIAALLGGGVGTASASAGRVVLAAAVTSSAAAAVAVAAPAIRAAHRHARVAPAALRAYASAPWQAAPGAGTAAAAGAAAGVATTGQPASPSSGAGHRSVGHRGARRHPAHPAHGHAGHGHRMSGVASRGRSAAGRGAVGAGASHGGGQAASPGSKPSAPTAANHAQQSGHGSSGASHGSTGGGSSHGGGSSGGSGSGRPAGGSSGGSHPSSGGTSHTPSTGSTQATSGGSTGSGSSGSGSGAGGSSGSGSGAGGSSGTSSAGGSHAAAKPSVQVQPSTSAQPAASSHH